MDSWKLLLFQLLIIGLMTSAIVCKTKMAQKPKSLLERAKGKLFFEKQDGALCGQHCLNNALQSSLFSAVDLSEIARQLDEKERQTMAERGTNTKEYKEFIANPSSNFDDSGYFSVQVLSEALRNMNLDLVSFNSDDARAVKARANSVDERLFICHMEDHWFSIRRFGTQWVNLNSTLSAPELLTDTYFNMLLSTLQQEGARLLVVFGELPIADADEAFSNLRRTDDGRYLDESTGHRLGDSSELDESVVMERGIRLSLAKTPAEAVSAQRAAFLSRFANASSSSASTINNQSSSCSSATAVNSVNTHAPSAAAATTTAEK